MQDVGFGSAVAAQPATARAGLGMRMQMTETSLSAKRLCFPYFVYLGMQIRLRKLHFASRWRLKSEVPTGLEVFSFRPF